MIRHLFHTLCALAVLTATTALAQDKTSKAKSWNLTGEVKARFDATVVDVLCELSGDCPANCGEGTRQLGLVRDDGRLFLANKNIQGVFSGAVADLLPYCQKSVEVDGLMVGEGDVKLYQVQLIREKGQEKWNKTTRFTKAWAAEFPEAKKKKGPWFRKDPRILKHIKKDGYLGLGLDVDTAFIKENE